MLLLMRHSDPPSLQVMYHVGVQLDITAPPTPKTAHSPSRLSQPQSGNGAQEGKNAHSNQQAVHSCDIPLPQSSTQKGENALSIQQGALSLGAPQNGAGQRPAPLQSPAASEQAQDYQQPATTSDSIDIPSGQQQQRQQQQQIQKRQQQDQQQLDQQHQSPTGQQRQLLQRQSAPAGNAFAAAAARAMLPDVSHLHINTHASHAAQKVLDLPECGEVSKLVCVAAA